MRFPCSFTVYNFTSLLLSTIYIVNPAARRNSGKCVHEMFSPTFQEFKQKLSAICTERPSGLAR